MKPTSTPIQDRIHLLERAFRAAAPQEKFHLFRTLFDARYEPRDPSAATEFREDVNRLIALAYAEATRPFATELRELHRRIRVKPAVTTLTLKDPS